jgi:hypothetical protein
MRFAKLLSSAAAAALVVLASASAWAQSYTCTSASNQWITPPASGTTFIAQASGTTQVTNLFANLDDANYTIPTANVPFPIVYWGTSYTTIQVGTNGHVGIGTGTILTTNYSPLTLGIAAGASNDGIIEVRSKDGDGYANSTNPACQYWTDGTAPNRKFIICWTGWHDYYQTGSCNFQVQFLETSNKIIVAYNTSGWTTTQAFGVGLDQPGGTGFCTPSGASNYSQSGTPTNDWVFAPPVINISGAVTYDRYVVNSTGIGNQSETNLPLANIKIEERDATGAVIASGYTNAQGVFNFQGKKDATITNGSIVVASGGLACNVRAVANGPLYSFPLAAGQSFAADIALAPVNITEGLDPGGTLRAPINIARSIQQVYDLVKPLTAKTISTLEVLHSSSVSTTKYTAKNGATPASMQVSGAAANPDPWDASVIRKTYGRHILGNIAADPGTPYDSGFNNVTDDFNAFAEGFGYYLNVAVSGEQIYYDGIDNKTIATRIDLENPSNTVLSAAPSSSVAGWDAAALYDLFDPANESWDTIDGTGAAGLRPILVVQSLSAPVSASTFMTQWNKTPGYDAVGLVRNFIHHGLIVDDADEPNDSMAETKLLTQFGFIRKNRVLSPFNEDWYSFTMPDPTNKLSVSVIFDRAKYAGTALTLEVRNSAGSLVMTGTTSSATSPYVAVSGALPADTYKVRVAVAAGTPIDNYTLQAFSELAFKSGVFQPWTVGRPINVPVDIKGGIPPYTLTVLDPFKKPDGLILDGVNLRVGGIPTGPQDAPIPPGGSYTYGFILSAVDAATPANTASGPINFTVNDTLKSHIGDFLAVPYNKPLDRKAPFAGGTPPYTTTIDEGSMPHGVSFATGELRLVGTADVPGAYPVQITGTDVALSAATAQTTGVVCTPLGSTTPIALGASASGFYFDAVQGSTVSIAVKMAPKQPKRVLAAQVLDTDGTTILDTNAKGGKGKATVKFTAPSTGRFYFVVSSDTGDASQVVSAGKVVATKTGSGEDPDINFVAGKQFTVKFGALAGAQLTFIGKPDKSGLALRALYLLDPNDNIVTIAPNEVTSKNGSIIVKKTLPTSTTENLSGTWKMLIGAQPGPQGHFTYAFRIAEPKGETYSVD